MNNDITVAAVQMERIVGDKEHNTQEILRYIKEAPSMGAQIVVFPELSTTGYFATEHNLKWFELAETQDGPTIQRIAQAAGDNGVGLVLPFFEFDPRRRTYYNSALVISSAGESIGLYRKRHIPETIWMYEKFYFTQGDLGYPVFDLFGCRIGVSICYDRHFPETYRHLTAQGAEIVFSVNNTPTARSRRVWEAEMIANSSGNGIYIVQVNAVGREGTQEFFGHSAISFPDGTISDRLGDESGVLLATLDLDAIQAARTHYSVMRDTRWEDLGLLSDGQTPFRPRA